MLYTTSKVAKILGCTKTTIINMENRGELKSSSSIGNRRVYSKGDLLTFINKNSNTKAIDIDLNLNIIYEVK